jgi:NAD(P)-dependent dehydrogenase (short-subunit alcohol dehydrogenase family)
MFKGRKAIVTGGSRGIGYAIASELSQRGATVLITGRNEESLKIAAKKIGGCVIPFVWDVSCIEKIEENFNKAIELLGGVDIIVNNAGVFTPKSEWNEKTYDILSSLADGHAMCVCTGRNLFYAYGDQGTGIVFDFAHVWRD